jgi:hypothetical protein
MTVHSHGLDGYLALQKMAEYSPYLPEEKEHSEAISDSAKVRPATPSAPEFEPYLDVEDKRAQDTEQESVDSEKSVDSEESGNLFSLQCPILIFLFLCLVVVAVESVKIARTAGTRAQLVFATIVLVSLMLIFFLIGAWLLIVMCGKSQQVTNTATAVALPFIFWLVVSVATSSVLGNVYRLLS